MSLAHLLHGCLWMLVSTALWSRCLLNKIYCSGGNLLVPTFHTQTHARTYTKFITRMEKVKVLGFFLVCHVIYHTEHRTWAQTGYSHVDVSVRSTSYVLGLTYDSAWWDESSPWMSSIKICSSGPLLVAFIAHSFTRQTVVIEASLQAEKNLSFRCHTAKELLSEHFEVLFGDSDFIVTSSKAPRFKSLHLTWECNSEYTKHTCTFIV